MSSNDVLEARKKHGGASIQILGIIGILQIAGGLYTLIQNPKQYPLAAALIAIGLFLTFLLRLQVWMLFRQNNKLQENFEATFSEHDGIDVASPTANTKYLWDGFVRYSETKSLFLVYQGKQVFIIFPKHAFAAGEVDAFRKLLDQHIGAVPVGKREKISLQTWVILAVVVSAAVLLVRAILNIMQSTPSG